MVWFLLFCRVYISWAVSLVFFFSVHCLLISSAGPDLQKAMELLQSGVTEESINDMIISGADAYGLGPRKSVYKCAYQFMRRRYMMALFLGLPDLTNVAAQRSLGIDSENTAADQLRSLAKQFVSQIISNFPRFHLLYMSVFEV